MIAFETNVRINRRIEEVFAYVSDPLNFPRWNSAVKAVRKTSVGEDGVASTYSMERELPTGRAINELEVVASEPPLGEPSPGLWIVRDQIHGGVARRVGADPFVSEPFRPVVGADTVDLPA